MRFLTTLSWVTGHGMSVVHGFSGGGRAMPLGRDRTMGFALTEEFDLSYFPETMDEKAMLALALMREGRGLNHPGYAFLTFYRVLEVAFPSRRVRDNWVTKRVAEIDDYKAKEALARLQSQGVLDVGAHLYESGRCAMAHAREEPIIDPDRPEDLRRLFEELPIMDSLATRGIESAFGVETPQTVYRKHLYELAGFKVVLGKKVVEKLAAGEQLFGDQTIEIPLINVRLRKHRTYAPLENLNPISCTQDGKTLNVLFQSCDGSVKLRLGMNFAAERLEFDMFRDIALRDSEHTPEHWQLLTSSSSSMRISAMDNLKSTTLNTEHYCRVRTLTYRQT